MMFRLACRVFYLGSIAPPGGEVDPKLREIIDQAKRTVRLARTLIHKSKNDLATLADLRDETARAVRKSAEKLRAKATD